MQISLRSPLIAGTAAVIGASAVAMIPVTAAHPGVASVQVSQIAQIAQVALAGFDSPLTDLISTIGVATNYLFNVAGDPTDAASWPYANFGTTLGGSPVLPTALGFAALGGFRSVGLLPQIIADGLPIIKQLGANGSDYINNTLNALVISGQALSEGVWNAAGYALGLNFPAAISALVTAITTTGATLLAAGTYVLTNVIAKIGPVLTAITGALPKLLGAFVAGGALVGTQIQAIVSDSLAALGAGNVEGAWNTVVGGLLGPSGIPGTLLNTTIGAGVQIGPLANVGEISATTFVPSDRGGIQAAVKDIAGALQTTSSAPPIPTPPAASARQRVAAQPAATAPRAQTASGAASEPAPQTAADGNGDGESTPKPVTHRASRASARDR